MIGLLIFVGFLVFYILVLKDVYRCEPPALFTRVCKNETGIDKDFIVTGFVQPIPCSHENCHFLHTIDAHSDRDERRGRAYPEGFLARFLLRSRQRDAAWDHDAIADFAHGGERHENFVKEIACMKLCPARQKPSDGDEHWVRTQCDEGSTGGLWVKEHSDECIPLGGQRESEEHEHGCCSDGHSHHHGRHTNSRCEDEFADWFTWKHAEGVSWIFYRGECPREEKQKEDKKHTRSDEDVEPPPPPPISRRMLSDGHEEDGEVSHDLREMAKRWYMKTPPNIYTGVDRDNINWVKLDNDGDYDWLRSGHKMNTVTAAIVITTRHGKKYYGPLSTTLDGPALP